MKLGFSKFCSWPIPYLTAIRHTFKPLLVYPSWEYKIYCLLLYLNHFQQMGTYDFVKIVACNASSKSCMFQSCVASGNLKLFEQLSLSCLVGHENDSEECTFKHWMNDENCRISRLSIVTSLQVTFDRLIFSVPKRYYSWRNDYNTYGLQSKLLISISGWSSASTLERSLMHFVHRNIVLQRLDELHSICTLRHVLELLPTREVCCSNICPHIQILYVSEWLLSQEWKLWMTAGLLEDKQLKGFLTQEAISVLKLALYVIVCTMLVVTIVSSLT